MGLKTLAAVRPSAPPAEKLDRVIGFIERAVSDARVPVTKGEIVAALGEVIAGLQHRETGRSLDDRV